MNTSFSTKLDEVSRTATKFGELFYDHLDKKRHQLFRLYMDNAICVFNGNGTTGKDAIQKFYQDLPITETAIASLDAQPIVDELASNQNTILVMASGVMRLGNQQKSFQQTFVITAQEDKWKIVSDCFRIQDALSTAALQK